MRIRARKGEGDWKKGEGLVGSTSQKKVGLGKGKKRARRDCRVSLERKWILSAEKKR